MELAYFAGFFDGEGCVHIARNIRVVISGCFHPGLLEQFSDKWGGRVTLSSWSGKNCRPGVRWEITGTKAGQFLDDVLPYLYEKQEQARLALQYQARKRALAIRGGKGYSAVQRSEFADMEFQIRQMKKVVHRYL